MSTIAAQFQLGEIHGRQGNFSEAAACYRQVLQTRPDHALTWRKLGYVLILGGNPNRAETAYRRAVELEPNDAEAHGGLAGVFIHQGKFEEAAAGYRRVLAIRPDDAHAHNNLGVALAKLEKFDAAVVRYQRALEIEPEYTVAHKNLGAALLNSGDPIRAEACYRRVLDRMPQDVEAVAGLAKSLVDQGDLDAALAAYAVAVEIEPEGAKGHADRALVWLKQGDFAKGWREYEWRLKCGCRSPRSDIPIWDGSPLEDRTILVYAEQGVGDEIMFASCLPELVDRAARCVVECDRRLVPLFRRSFPTAMVVARGDDPARFAAAGRIDVRIAAGSVPRYLRPSLDRFGRAASYLVADRERCEQWSSRLAAVGEGLRVGISWRGGGKPGVRKSRSIRLDRFKDLLTEPGTCFVNLQYGDSADELDAAGKQWGMEVHDFEEADALEDLDGFAAYVSSLDLVISVDNSTVHLAGALGVPVWVLLPRPSNWRWIVDRDDSPWYPGARLFSQTDVGDWSSVLGRLAGALRELVSNKRDVGQGLP